MNINDNDIIQIPRKELNCQIENFKRAVSQRNKIEKENQKLQKRIATLEKYREEPHTEVVRLQNCNCEFKKENKKLREDIKYFFDEADFSDCLTGLRHTFQNKFNYVINPVGDLIAQQAILKTNNKGDLK